MPVPHLRPALRRPHAAARCSVRRTLRGQHCVRCMPSAVSAARCSGRRPRDAGTALDSERPALRAPHATANVGLCGASIAPDRARPALPTPHAAACCGERRPLRRERYVRCEPGAARTAGQVDVHAKCINFGVRRHASAKSNKCCNSYASPGIWAPTMLRLPIGWRASAEHGNCDGDGSTACPQLQRPRCNSCWSATECGSSANRKNDKEVVAVPEQIGPAQRHLTRRHNSRYTFTVRRCFDASLSQCEQARTYMHGVARLPTTAAREDQR